MSGPISYCYEDIQNVTPSDSAKVPGNVAAGFGADVAGTMQVTTLAGTTVVRTVLAGVWYPCAITKIWATNTNATGTFCFYDQLYRARPSV